MAKVAGECPLAPLVHLKGKFVPYQACSRPDFGSKRAMMVLSLAESVRIEYGVN